MKRLIIILSAAFISSTAFTQCNELFFSEYIEGSSNNKAFEVYNPSETDVDLSDYVIYRNNNGSPIPSDSLFPVGMLVAGDVFVIANFSAIPAILDEADTLHTLTYYNGDDAVWLKKISTGDTLDIIGVIGEDPGSGWPIGDGATNNHTIIRQMTVNAGELDWAIASTQWDAYAINMVDSLGAHTMIPCVDCNTSSSITVVECDSYVSPSETTTWFTSGVYLDTIPNMAGCDSVITIDLTINYSDLYTFEVDACDMYLSPSGEVWTESGMYVDTIPTMTGCDSILYISLTINTSAAYSYDVVACESYVSPSGEVWTESGVYVDTIATVAGCDSVITVDLTIVNIDVTVTQTDNELEVAETGATYQWLDCNADFAIIGGETNQVFVVTSDGSYAVQVTKDVCVDTSECTTIVGFGIIESDFGVTLTSYPNPTTGQFIIELGQEQDVINATIYNSIGEVVGKNTFNQTQLLTFTINGDAGVYFIELITNTGKTARARVIKQ